MIVSQKTATLVIGATNRPEKYGYKAVKSLLSHGHKVHAIGVRKGFIDDVEIQNEKVLFDDVDTVTLYINPTIQIEYYNYILQLKPRRVIFNPGTENYAFYPVLKAAGIAYEEACSLVLLHTRQY